MPQFWSRSFIFQFYSQQPFFSTQPTTHSSYLTQRVKMENIQSPTPSPRRSQNYPETFYNDIPRHYHLGTYRNEHRGVIVGNVNEPNYPYQMFQKGCVSQLNEVLVKKFNI